ncbi:MULTISPECIES: hypothetical protein [Bradyrhizobium]|uniref:hypothetical protein n=1 Tax=Bradyrhizobium TaxID=374 RepID=UPI0007C48F2B|nr:MULTISPECIES: hypothetical protein [Bradyrhizobium]
MVGAIGNGIGGIGSSLARGPHGNTDGHRPHAPAPHPDHSRPGGADNREHGAVDSSSTSQADAQRQAFEAALSSIAMQFTNDAMAEFDDAMAETDENA